MNPSVSKNENQMLNKNQWKFIIFWLGACIVGLPLAIAYISNNKIQDSTQIESIRLEPASFDYGTVLQAETIHHEFHLINSSTNELQIFALHTTCSCTVVSNGLLGEIIEPGKRVSVPVDFDTADRDGPSSSAITILLLDANGRKYMTEARLHGTVLADLEVSPQMVDFGTVKVGECQTKFVSIRPKAIKEFKILGLKTTQKEFRSTLLSTDHENSNVIRVAVILGPVATRHREILNDYLQVVTTSPRVPVLHIPLEGQVLPSVAVAPETLVFSPENKSDSSTVTIRTESPSRIVQILGAGSDGSVDIRTYVKTPSDWSLVHSCQFSNADLSALRQLSVKLEIKTGTDLVETQSVSVKLKSL